MLPPENPLNSLAKQVMSRLNGKESESGGVPKYGMHNSGQSNSSNCGANDNSSCNKPFISPAKALVIAGLVGGVLDIDSVLVDRDQEVQIVLAGSLKQKTSLDKTMDEIGSMPFDDVLRAMVGRL